MVTRRRLLLLLGGGAAAAAAAVAGFLALPGEEGGVGPPVIRYGEEVCAYCGMTIGDARFACAWRTASGAARRFDDIGCMVNAARRQDPGSDTRFWVHDYGDEAWLEAPVAHYLIAPAIKTPMAYGLAAFARPEAAQALAGTQRGRTYGWDALLTELERKG